MQEAAIYSILGRSGTTFLRNILAKEDELICLTSDAQIKLLHDVHNKEKAERFARMSHYLDSDVRTKFGRHHKPKRISDCQWFVYKLPLFQMLIDLQLSQVLEIPSIFITRHPVGVVLSASTPDFVNASVPRDLLFQGIETTAALFELKIAPALRSAFAQGDIFTQNAILAKMSIQLYQAFFKRQKEKQLVFSIELLSLEPKQHLKNICDFLELDFNTVWEHFYQSIYLDIIEEGGIKMNQNLERGRVHRVFNGVTKDTLDRIWSLLADEATQLGYSYDYNEMPNL